jgi:hypothetical protein
MSLIMNVNAKVMKGLEEMFQANTTETIKILAKNYGFNEEEARVLLNVTEEVKIVKGKTKVVKEVKEKGEKGVKEKKEKKEVPKIVLPFCGRVLGEWCEGVKLNHGLYSQCVSEKCASDEKYCKSCKKQAETNESGKPTLGDINERMLTSSAEYRALKGKKCVVYAVVMKKLKIEKGEAVAEALKFGLEIPEEEFEMPKSQRGRPKKLSESESVKSESDDGEKKRRGRPKKNKTVADNETDETDDLIALLVAEANALKSGNASEADSSEADSSEADSSEADSSEADSSEADSSEGEEEADAEEEGSAILKQIIAKIGADETYNKMNSMVVPKKDRKQHLNAMGEHIKTLLTEEELALYTGAPEEEASEAEADEAEADEAEKKAQAEAEKKAQAEAEKKAKKEQADLEKKQKAKEKKDQADAEKKAKADLEKKAKAEADAEKKAQADLEKKAKAEADAEKKAQADLEKKAKAEADKKAKKEQADLEKKAKKEQADLEKKAKAEADKKAKAEADKKAKAEAEGENKEKKPAEKKEKKPAEKKEKKPAEKQVAEVKPVEKEASAELQTEVVEETVEVDAEAVNAKVFEFQGKKYLKTDEGILYDQSTEECVGVWNEETKSIDDFADDEE